MSFFMGGAGSNADTPTVYTGIQVQTSAQGVPVTLMWGKARCAPNLFWYNNFQSHKQSGKGAGGKGGGKGSQGNRVKEQMPNPILSLYLSAADPDSQYAKSYPTHNHWDTQSSHVAY